MLIHHLLGKGNIETSGTVDRTWRRSQNSYFWQPGESHGEQLYGAPGFCKPCGWVSSDEFQLQGTVLQATQESAQVQARAQLGAEFQDEVLLFPGGLISSPDGLLWASPTERPSPFCWCRAAAWSRIAWSGPVGVLGHPGPRHVQPKNNVS
jgi:hypothetical protein